MTNSHLLLEICVDSFQSIQNAIKGGADRLELCSALSEGGLTPSFGLVKLAKRISTIPIFVMIRIRGGDFIYDSEEIDVMLEDLKLLKSLKVAGFVFGALTTTNEVDVLTCKKIIEVVKPYPITFHRAFDNVSDPIRSLDVIRELGFMRILTSGQKKSAIEGINLISKLIEYANNKIIVIPGAGINESNILHIRNKTQAIEFHSSATSLNKNRVNSVSYGEISITDVKIVELMVQALNSTYQ